MPAAPSPTESAQAPTLSHRCRSVQAPEIVLVLGALVPLVAAVGAAVRRCGAQAPAVFVPGGVDVQAEELNRPVESGR